MTKLLNKLSTLFNSSNNGTVWTAYNSQGGQINQDQRIELVFHRNMDPDKSTVTLRETYQFLGSKKNLHTLNGKFIAEIANWVDTMFMTVAGYRRVLRDDNWGKLFQVKNGQVKYIEGTTEKDKNESTMPCYNCGLVLPVGHMTVDHHKPQSGGEDQAVLKNLRNMGYNLTHDGGHGGVAKAYISGNFQALPTKSAPPVLPTFSTGMDLSGNVQEEDRKPYRYTLTDRGITFLSVAIAAATRPTVTSLCMHSAFNLKPYCAKCNIKKSNKLTDLSWIND